MRADGVSGSLEFLGDRIVIRKKGWPYGHKSEKTVPLTAIAAIQFKNAGALVGGYIQIAYSGSREVRGGSFNAASDENSITFTRPQEGPFIAIRQAIENARSDRGPGVGITSEPDPIGQLERLAALHQSGALTDDEFAAAKARLLT